MTRITLPCRGIEIELSDDGESGTITSDLKEKCFCGKDAHIDTSKSEAECMPLRGHNAWREDAKGKILFNAMIDVVEGLILAHAVAGIDVTSPAYLEGVETVVDALCNNVE